VMTAPTGSSQTVTDLLAATVVAHPERPALTYRSAPTWRHARTRRAGAWHTLTWHETAHLVLATMKRLDDVIGAHDTVALLADTNVRYPIVELALALSGRAIQPLYVSSTDDELRRAVSLTGADAAIVDGERRDRARSLGARLSLLDLEEVVRLPGFDHRPHTCLPPDVEPFDATVMLRRLGELPRRPSRSPLLYLQSTGTTGPAKVIEVSEPALVAAVSAVRDESSHPFPRFLSFLPTAHISERLLTLYLSVALAGHTWFGAGLQDVATDLKACRPTVLLAPPLLLDAIREQAMRQAGSTPAGRRLAASVQRTADKAIELGRGGMTRRPVGARLFGRSVRRQTGLTKVRDVFSGTAPAPAEVLGWWEAIGMPVRNVYGQTEVTGATSITSLRHSCFMGVGTPVKGTDVRIAPDGELLVRSRSAFTGYVGEPEATAATLPDGWLHTGDRAYIDQTGEIVLLGRVQAVTYGRDGEPVDTAPLLAQITGHFSPASAACVASPTGAGLCLYLAMHPRDVPVLELEHVGLRSVAHEDIRWARLGALLARADEHRVIGWVAIFDGAFTQATGEVGPTGKTRGWRIHELHSHHLRKLRTAPYTAASWPKLPADDRLAAVQTALAPGSRPRQRPPSNQWRGAWSQPIGPVLTEPA
jgi:long-chain acyl-CoA synthetase